jgi:hypothetical protein
MAEVTKRPWSIKYTDPQYENQEFDLKDVNLEKLNPKALNTYIVDFIYSTELTNSMNTALLREFQEDFQEWSVKAFKMVQKGIRSELRTVLKHKRVYTPIPTTKNPNSRTLATLVTIDPDPWPQRKLEDLLAKPMFVSAAQRARSGKASSAALAKATLVPQVVQPVGNPLQAQVLQISHIPIPQATPQAPNPQVPNLQIPQQQPAGFIGVPGVLPGIPGFPVNPSIPPGIPPLPDVPPIPIYAPSGGPPMGPGLQLSGLQQQMASLTVTPEAPGKLIATLKKFYISNDQKFRAGHYEVLNFKLRDFYKAYNAMGITPANYHPIYSNMLAGNAFNFYNSHLAYKNLFFDQMVEKNPCLFSHI